MIIKEANKLSDAKLIADIYRSDIGKFGTTHTEKEVQRIENEIRKELKELGQRRIVYIGFEENRPVGTVQLVFMDKNPMIANASTIANMHHLRVAYDLHGKGLGKLLINKAEQEAKNRGYKKMTLSVEITNQKATEVYQHLGYQKLRGITQEDSGEKEVFMYKDLQEGQF